MIDEFYWTNCDYLRTKNIKKTFSVNLPELHFVEIDEAELLFRIRFVFLSVCDESGNFCGDFIEFFTLLEFGKLNCLDAL